ncbi:hypothetical protein ACFSTC_62345 [Nonomuraea ferruginea]
MGNFPRIVLILLWLAVCLAPIPVAVPDYLLTLGHTGTPGTLTVVSCESLGRGRYDCRGRFVPDDGGQPVIVATSPDSDAGDVTHARLTPRRHPRAPRRAQGRARRLRRPGRRARRSRFPPVRARVLVGWAEGAQASGHGGDRDHLGGPSDHGRRIGGRALLRHTRRNRTTSTANCE